MIHEFCFFAKKQEDAVWKIEDAAELLHLNKVLRLKTGAKVCLLDGKGKIAYGALGEIGNKQALVSVSEVITQPAPPPRMLAIAALKPAAFEESLPAICELGIARVHIYNQDGNAKHHISDKNQLRWQRIVYEACKQSKRAHLLDIEVWPSFKDFTKNAKREGLNCFYADMGGGKFEKNENESYLIHIGSEKGFTSEEYTYFSSSNIPPITLSPYTLRAKTAIVAASTLLSCLEMR